MRKRFAVLTVPALIAAAFTVTGAAHAPDARSIPVDLRLGSAAGSGLVKVDLEIAENFSKLGIPQRLVDEPLTTIALRAAGAQRISVPVTSLVLTHASSGVATYEFFAWFGDHEATAMESLPVAPAPGNAAAAMLARALTWPSPTGELQTCLHPRSRPITLDLQSYN